MNAMHDICSVPDLAAFQHSLNPSGQLYDTYDIATGITTPLGLEQVSTG